MVRFFRAHKRVSVIILSWVAFCAFSLIPNWREGPFYFLFFSALFVTLIASQLFWIGRVVGLGERFIPGKPRPGHGHCKCCLSLLLRLQHRPLGHPAGRFDPFDPTARFV